MKKLLTIILILALAVPAAALADLPDISSLSYDELIQLKDQLNLAIWNSQEWQEVEVPAGTYQIGATERNIRGRTRSVSSLICWASGSPC